MRLLHGVVLLVALVVGQVRTCADTVVCPDGDVCSVCATSQSKHTSDSLDMCAGTAAADTDCETCCELKDVPRHEASKTSASQVVSVPVLAMPDSVVIVFARCPAEPEQSFFSPAAYWKNAPPGGTDSRAPPVPSA